MVITGHFDRVQFLVSFPSDKSTRDLPSIIKMSAKPLCLYCRQMYGDDLMKGNLPQSNDAMDQRCVIDLLPIQRPYLICPLSIP